MNKHKHKHKQSGCVIPGREGAVFCAPPPPLLVGGGDDDDEDWVARSLLSSGDGSWR